MRLRVTCRGSSASTAGLSLKAHLTMFSPSRSSTKRIAATCWSSVKTACCSCNRDRTATLTTIWCQTRFRARCRLRCQRLKMDVLLQPFQFEFFRNGTITAVLVGGLCGLIGVYIVLRGMSYIGHGLSHAIFGGAVVSFVMAWNFYAGAGLWGFIAAVMINQTVRRTKISADAAIGVITTASFAVGGALISRYRRFTRSFDRKSTRL